MGGERLRRRCGGCLSVEQLVAVVGEVDDASVDDEGASSVLVDRGPGPLMLREGGIVAALFSSVKKLVA